MSDTGIDTSRAHRFLEGLPERPETSPRALVVDSAGSTIFQSGDVTLPLALSGVTKLSTLAMVLREVDRGALSLDTPMGEILPSDTVRGLCVVGGQDHSFSITIEHLPRIEAGLSTRRGPGATSCGPLSSSFWNTTEAGLSTKPSKSPDTTAAWRSRENRGEPATPRPTTFSWVRSCRRPQE